MNSLDYISDVLQFSVIGPLFSKLAALKFLSSRKVSAYRIVSYCCVSIAADDFLTCCTMRCTFARISQCHCKAVSTTATYSNFNVGTFTVICVAKIVLFFITFSVVVRTPCRKFQEISRVC